MSNTSGKPHADSLNGRFSRLKVGGRDYIEATLENWQFIQRAASSITRRPASMDGMKFTCSLHTAIGASKAGDIRYLVCVERTA